MKLGAPRQPQLKLGNETFDSGQEMSSYTQGFAFLIQNIHVLCKLNVESRDISDANILLLQKL